METRANEYVTNAGGLSQNVYPEFQFWFAGTYPNRSVKDEQKDRHRDELSALRNAPYRYSLDSIGFDADGPVAIVDGSEDSYCRQQVANDQWLQAKAVVRTTTNYYSTMAPETCVVGQIAGFRVEMHCIGLPSRIAFDKDDRILVQYLSTYVLYQLE
jgi:hypothetical protein